MAKSNNGGVNAKAVQVDRISDYQNSVGGKGT